MTRKIRPANLNQNEEVEMRWGPSETVTISASCVNLSLRRSADSYSLHVSMTRLGSTTTG